jgi:hypothetical protein
MRPAEQFEDPVAGSQWTMTGPLVLGSFGAGALNIGDGGRVVSGSAYLGANSVVDGTNTISANGTAAMPNRLARQPNRELVSSVSTVSFRAAGLSDATPMLRGRPSPQRSKKFCQRGGLIMSVQAAGVRKNPGVAAAEEFLLQADAGLFVARDDSVGTKADEGDDGWTSTLDFRGEQSAAGAEFVVAEFIGAGRCPSDDIRDPELKVEQGIAFKRREEARCEAAPVQSRPKAVAWAAEMMPDRGGV